MSHRQHALQNQHGTPRDSLDLYPREGEQHYEDDDEEELDEDFVPEEDGNEDETQFEDDEEGEYDEDYNAAASAAAGNGGQQRQQKVYVDYPSDILEDANEYRFVSSRIGDSLDDKDADKLHHQESQRRQQRYQAVDLSPTGVPLSHRGERLPVYGQTPTQTGSDRDEDAEAADLELAGEIRYQREMQRRLDRMANDVAAADSNIPPLDLLHIEDPTASQQHLYRDSLDIDLRDHDTEDTEDDEALANQHPHPVGNSNRQRQQQQNLSSNRQAEIDHVTRLSRQLGGRLQIEADYYDSGRNPPSDSGGPAHSTVRTPQTGAAAAGMPTAEELEFLRKLKRDLVYGGQVGPHRQMMVDGGEAEDIRPESLRKPLPQVKKNAQKQRQKQQQQQSDKDFVEDNKKLPTNRVPTKSYGKLYREKKVQPDGGQRAKQQKQKQKAKQDVEVAHLDREANSNSQNYYQDEEHQAPPEQVWMSRMAALQTVAAVPSRSKAAAGGVADGGKQNSADPRLQQQQQQQLQFMADEMQPHRHSVPADQMMQAGSERPPVEFVHPEANWPGYQYPQQVHYVTTFDINGQPVTLPVAGPAPPQMQQQQQAAIYPYQQYPAYPVQQPQPQQQFITAQQPHQQQAYGHSPRAQAPGAGAGLSHSQDMASTTTPRMVIDESTLNRQFKYVGIKMAGAMSRSPPGRYHTNPLPPIPGGVKATAAATGAPATKKIDSRELDKEVSGYSSKFQQSASSPGYTPYNVSDFQNVKSVATLGGLGHDKENEGYRMSHQLYKKKQQYAKAIGNRNRANLEAGKRHHPPAAAKRQEGENQKEVQSENQQQQSATDPTSGATLSEAEIQAKREAQEKRLRMQEYSKNLQSQQQQQQQQQLQKQQQLQQQKQKRKTQTQTGKNAKQSGAGVNQSQKSTDEVDKLLHDPELEMQKQRHLEDKKRSDSIRQQIAAS